MARTLCIVLIGTRQAADVRFAAASQRWGHSFVALIGKELTAFSCEPTMSSYLTGHVAMQEIAEIPFFFSAVCGTLVKSSRTLHPQSGWTAEVSRVILLTKGHIHSYIVSRGDEPTGNHHSLSATELFSVFQLL